MSRVAAVTGASTGIGRATAVAFGELGWTVAVGARRLEQLEETAKLVDGAGGRALVHVLDVTDSASVDAFCDFVTRAAGPIDVLVNNAFRMDVFQPFDQVDLAKWRKIFDVNVWGSLAITQACVPHLKKAAADQGDASIVFIISMSMRKIRSLEGGYSSSKAALQTAAKTMALELGPAGVRVNCIAPGFIGGPNVEVYLGWESEARGISRDDVRREIESNIPLGRIPPQDEIANSVVFFISPWSSVITGQTLDVNGGEFFG